MNGGVSFTVAGSDGGIVMSRRSTMELPDGVERVLRAREHRGPGG